MAGDKPCAPEKKGGFLGHAWIHPATDAAQLALQAPTTKHLRISWFILIRNLCPRGFFLSLESSAGPLHQLDQFLLCSTTEEQQRTKKEKEKKGIAVVDGLGQSGGEKRALPPQSFSRWTARKRAARKERRGRFLG